MPAREGRVLLGRGFVYWGGVDNESITGNRACGPDNPTTAPNQTRKANFQDFSIRPVVRLMRAS